MYIMTSRESILSYYVLDLPRTVTFLVTSRVVLRPVQNGGGLSSHCISNFICLSHSCIMDRLGGWVKSKYGLITATSGTFTSIPRSCFWGTRITPFPQMPAQPVPHSIPPLSQSQRTFTAPASLNNKSFDWTS